MIMMQLDNGSQACYLQCHYTPDGERNYTFIGTKGRIENIGDCGRCAIHVWTQRGSRHAPDIIYDLKPVEGTHGGADPAIVKAFLEFVRHDVKPNTSPIAARNAVAVGCLGINPCARAATPRKYQRCRENCSNISKADRNGNSQKLRLNKDNSLFGCSGLKLTAKGRFPTAGSRGVLPPGRGRSYNQHPGQSL